jgi:cysteine synthase
LTVHFHDPARLADRGNRPAARRAVIPAGRRGPDGPDPDAASIAAARIPVERTGHRAGGSTGTNLWDTFRIISELRDSGARGSLVTLLCDGGERCAHTYYDDAWLTAQGIDIAPYDRALREFPATGVLR